jgi:hypothetical protein
VTGQDVSTPWARRLAGVIAIIATTAIITQLGLNFFRAAEQGKPLWLVPIDLYGYFTIWSNTLVAIITARYARGGDEQGLFGRPWLLAATVVYIVVVGLIYNLLLAGYNPQTGLRKAIDLTFHTIIPIAYPLWWLTQVPRGRLGWNALAPALVFPIAYSFVAMGKGAITGKYAYFFIDVGKYGVPQVLLNIGGLALLYAALMAVVIAFDRRARGGAAMDAAA